MAGMRSVERMARALDIAFCLASLWCITACNTFSGTPAGTPGPPSPSIVVSGTATNLNPGQGVTLTAVVNATDTKVRWTTSPSGFGTLSSTTDNPVTYTAPDTVMAVTVVTITATLVSNPSVRGGWRLEVNSQ